MDEVDLAFGCAGLFLFLIIMVGIIIIFGLTWDFPVSPR